MAIYLGIDVGAVSIKVALLMERSEAERIPPDAGADSLLRFVTVPAAGRGGRDLAVMVSPYRRTRGRPLEAIRSLLAGLTSRIPADSIAAVMLTGSGSELPAKTMLASRCNEFQALARAVDLLRPEAHTVFEMGGESSKYLRMLSGPGGGPLGIVDYSANGDCAAGTGAFLDQQAGRLKFAVEDIGRIVATADRAAQIAGRCSVFAKSDMIHAQQKGFEPHEVLKGLCKAVAVNYKSAVVKGRTPEPPVILVGGVSANSAVVDELREVFEFDAEQLQVPQAAESFTAIGAAVLASESPRAGDVREQLARLNSTKAEGGYRFVTSPPLTLDHVRILRDRVRPYRPPANGQRADAWLGLDIGSVGTKLVIIDDAGEVLHSIFTRTEGRPIEVVSRCLKEMERAVGEKVRVRGVGTTGSGRELIGELIGADSITDEITCHKTGATFVGDRMLGRRPDTIFEIGGQDSKYISLQSESGESSDTIVVDFTMNEACAAGTGSFLEERAEELNVSIKGEFSAEAFKSKAPIKLGERCTVFMERDVNTYMQRGAKREDVIAGLAYSVVYNYINRVVRGRLIGDCVFFQGGTAYNDAVAAAFSAVTNKEIIVPPHNAVLGAIGAAMLAREKIASSGGHTRFRGYHTEEVEYALREFTCRGCGNHCAVQEFNVEGEKTYWGDKCSDRYRKRVRVDHKPVLEDLVALRRELIGLDDTGDPRGAAKTIGVPLTMYTYDLLPLWRRFFRDCGFNVLVSEETNRRIVKQGYDTVVAEPCFPIIVAHGHVAELAARNVDYIWLPNIMSAESKTPDNESHFCPWGQTLPFVIRQAPAFRAWQDRILCPLIRLKNGPEAARQALTRLVADLGVDGVTAEHAFTAAWEAQQCFKERYQEAGTQALDQLIETGEKGIVLAGRPYNVHDAGVTLSIARKLREHYGVNVIPIDALPVADVDIRDINENMFWEYGQRILAAARLVGQHPNLHLIYITNFKCGPDSFIKSFIQAASGKPFLTLQFDGHSNDAGIMTRCEAYLDSKGILRWWRKQGKDQGRASKADDSTSRRWLTPEPGSWPPASAPSGSTRPPHRTPMPKP
ncbi:MAG TPA: acyl-CoA dehydratase activase [Phycisphaerae bacterium]|nr:acyl-CoA dehydratase activase [Phycisphaerae bacterium]